MARAVGGSGLEFLAGCCICCSGCCYLRYSLIEARIFLQSHSAICSSHLLWLGSLHLDIIIQGLDVLMLGVGVDELHDGRFCWEVLFRWWLSLAPVCCTIMGTLASHCSMKTAVGPKLLLMEICIGVKLLLCFIHRDALHICQPLGSGGLFSAVLILKIN